MTNQPPKPTVDAGAMARLKELTAYMSDEQREKLVREGRSETYETYMRGKREALACVARLVGAIESSYMKSVPCSVQQFEAAVDALANFEKLSGGGA